MKKTFKKFISLVLVVVCCLSLSACGKKEVEVLPEEPFGGAYYNTIGAGRRSFYFYFQDNLDHCQNFCINTDSAYLFEAFRENNMIISKRGETVTHFAGCQADETNGYKWVLYANGEKVEENYEDVKIDANVIYSLIAEQIK